MNAGIANDPIIFVTGASRSGTTLLSRILGNHPAILALRELHFFGDLCPLEDCDRVLPDARLERMAAMMLARQARDFWVKAPTDAEQAVARELVATIPPEQRTGAKLYAVTVSHLARAAGKRIACEQTPRNIYYAGRILGLFEQVRFIHMVRDPRAVLASQKNRWQVRRLGGTIVPVSEVIRLWFNYHPLTASRLWLSATDTALSLQSHPAFRMVSFEALAASPEATVGELCGWLGIDYRPELLNVPQWGSSNVRPQGEGSGVSAVMVDKWKEVLSPGEIAISERVTGPTLEKVGYARTAQSGLGWSGWLQLVLRYPVHVCGAVLTNPRRVLIQIRALLGARGKAA